ncbi:DUF2617 family protein [Gordonia sp. CPCC 206044]|uniref:DUF2617 family protein n=1 Tax=Gordonia sp. CPCC 206044 TaxID=3140793 RepID=UPI003AF35509
MTGPTRLEVPYADTSARHLAFSLTAELREPLARCDHHEGGCMLSLRLLGASHQVVVTADDATLCETVACLPGVDEPLPGVVDDGAYSFTSRIETCDDDRMTALVADLTRRIADHRATDRPAVIGHFPGRPLAVTAVLATVHADIVRWDTWHTYPQTSEVVLTSSALRRGGEARR